jgi:hypothetical protein
MRVRAGALAGAACAACVCGALLEGWLAPDNVLALWTLVSFCG